MCIKNIKCEKGCNQDGTKKFNWIREDVVIDFDVPKSLLEIIVILEQKDKEEDYDYFNYSEALDHGAKEYVVKGRLTKKQWDTLCLKYDGSD